MTNQKHERVVVCRVGAERFALPIAAVREIVAAPELTRIPGAPHAVRGLANVRGILVTAVSGRDILGTSGYDRGDWLVILAMRDGRIGVVMDEVEDLELQDGTGSVPVLDIEALIGPLFAAEASRA